MASSIKQPIKAQTPANSSKLNSLKNRIHIIRTKTGQLVESQPLLSFFGLLGLLLLLIIVGNFLRQPPAATETVQTEPKLVQAYTSTQAPTMTFSAHVEKSGVIHIYAQSAGIVQAIKMKEGQHVKRGTTLVSLSTNYQGGNVASISRQIAQKNFEFNEQNLDAQKDIIANQKDLATKAQTQAAELRDINSQSFEATRSLISLNQDILHRIEDQIKFLESTNVGGANDAAILGALQGKAAAQSGLTQLESSFRVLEYQSDDSKTPTQISDMSRDVTIKQLDLQEKSLVLAKDISELNVKLARISESLMYPASPCPGVVERIYVNIGQSVTPGTLIATIAADQGENTAIVSVTREVAQQISSTEPSVLRAGEERLELYPRYVSTEATEGNLYTVLYDIPTEFSSSLTNAELLQIKIPVGNKTIAASNVIVPLDAIYQTQDKAYVSVMRQDEAGQTIARTVEVNLGQVSGSYVQITAGLSADDQIITSRNVQDGDTVRLE